jgi:NAD(P)-dependent dehydrogenase (short-subunit alcohol dehydrogenase family)
MAPADRRGAAIVTGASYGIGSASALALARKGFDVAVSDLTVETLAETVAAIRNFGRRAFAVALDLRSTDGIASAFSEVTRACGPVDVLVNNAGVTLRGPALEVTRAQWDEVIAVNATGTFFMCQQMGRHLIGAGRPGAIISIASTYAVVGQPGQAAYGVTKAAVSQMTRMLAIEWAAHGVRVNAVAPGRTDTPSPARQASARDPVRREQALARIPMRRFGKSEEIGGLVAYLASPQASYITGQTILIDGGLTAW